MVFQEVTGVVITESMVRGRLYTWKFEHIRWNGEEYDQCGPQKFAGKKNTSQIVTEEMKIKLGKSYIPKNITSASQKRYEERRFRTKRYGRKQD